MTDRDRLLRVMTQHFDQPTVGVEVGVWQGMFSKCLLEALQPYVMYLVDPWLWDNDTGGDKYYYITSTKLAKSQADMNKLYFKVVQDFARDTNVRVLRLKSVEAAPLFTRLDWVYIDGSHDYESALSDLEVWAPKVRPGGLICGDDYKWTTKNGKRPVFEAVETFLKRNPLFRSSFYVIQSPGCHGQFYIEK